MTNRLLIVDDDPQTLAVVEAHLAAYEVETVSSSEAASRAIARALPDLVLLALAQPLGSALLVLSSLRDGAPHVPVIALFTEAERSQRASAVEAGAADVLEKPLDPALLSACVRRLLRLRQAHEELTLSRDALCERNREIERIHGEQRELIELLVHDLKNPLMVVSGNLEFLGSPRGVPERLQGAVADARAATERLQTFVQDLLTVSQLDHARLSVRREVVDVASIARAVLALYAHKAQERGITLTVCPSSPLYAACDVGLLHRVLENIVDNSFRYTPSGGRIRAQMGIALLPDAAIEVTISNSGSPIPKEPRERIFEKLARSSDNPVVAANVGIGLYFCKRVAEAHGGTIDVTQTAEWPTSFVLRLPRA